MRLCARTRWLAWLLPFFVLRALVPAGFMWAPVDGGIPLVLCSGVSSRVLPSFGATPAAGEHAGHEAHAEHASPSQMSSHGHRSAGSAQHHAGHQRDGGDRDDPSHQASLCAFAVAGLAFVDGLNHAPFDALTTRELASPVYDDTFRDQGPLGVVRIRGPPLGS